MSAASFRPTQAARPAKPDKIYRRGKAVGADLRDDEECSDEDEEAAEQGQVPAIEDEAKPITTLGLSQAPRPSNLSIAAIDPNHITRASSETSSSGPSSSNLNDQRTKSACKQTAERPGSSSDDDSGSSEELDTSSEEEEEEDQLKPIFKPTFTSKKDRLKPPVAKEPSEQAEDEYTVEEKKMLEEHQRRKAQSQKLVELTLQRELAEKQVEEVFPEVDDTDGLDPDTEFESWRLRELKRLTRERDQLLQREKEKQELEARRTVPEDQRLEDDLKYAEETRKAKPKTKQVFLQKYHHKGVFYADDEILKKHDYNAPTEGTFKKMELLPSVMQVRDFGKMSRTKWTHLVKEDTTQFDSGWNQHGRPRASNGQASDGCFFCGDQNHKKKDCPNRSGLRERPDDGRRRTTDSWTSGSRTKDRNNNMSTRDGDAGGNAVRHSHHNKRAEDDSYRPSTKRSRQEDSDVEGRGTRFSDGRDVGHPCPRGDGREERGGEGRRSKRFDDDDDDRNRRSRRRERSRDDRDRRSNSLSPRGRDDCSIRKSRQAYSYAESDRERDRDRSRDPHRRRRDVD